MANRYQAPRSIPMLAVFVLRLPRMAHAKASAFTSPMWFSAKLAFGECGGIGTNARREPVRASDMKMILCVAARPIEPPELAGGVACELPTGRSVVRGSAASRQPP